MIHITTGTGKMENMDSINVSSLSNPYCKKMRCNPKFVCNTCYSNRFSIRRPTLEQKLFDNTLELCLKPIIDVPVINRLFFRLNSFGELYNDLHYENYLTIVKSNPNVLFSLWTKRVNIVSKYEKPDNLILIYSNPIVNSSNEFIPNGFDKVFMVFSQKYINENNTELTCKKSCINCLKCYTKGDKDKIIRERKK